MAVHNYKLCIRVHGWHGVCACVCVCVCVGGGGSTGGQVVGTPVYNTSGCEI